ILVISEPMIDFASEVHKHYKKAARGAWCWSFAHHGSGIFSILSSAGAAFLAATNLSGLSGTKPALIAALSGAAAALTTISAFAGFSKKWRINRKTRTALMFLELDLERQGETTQLRERFKTIMQEHDVGIGAAEPE
ncbi:MAG TPA: hypothetical protein VM711_10265, partial [Sphingomicrobium sp.]|nr:hypothetical protein [Sphingomicrobium sp.]